MVTTAGRTLRLVLTRWSSGDDGQWHEDGVGTERAAHRQI